MSTASSSTNSNRYVDFDEYVEFQLEKTRRSIRFHDLLTAGAAAFAMILGGILAFVVLDHWLIPGGFSVSARWCWFLGFTSLISAWLVWKIGIPACRTVNRLFAARELEQADPALRSNLLNWVDLRDAGRDVNPVIMRTIEKQAATELSRMDVGQAIDHRPLLQTAYALLAIVVLFCGYALFSPKKISSSLWRMLPFTNAGAVTRTEILEVTPGDATLSARGRLQVSVLLAGEIPAEVKFLYSTADGRIQDEAVVLRPESEGIARYLGVFAGETGSGVVQDFTYRIIAGDTQSKRYRVTVHQPPSATVQHVSLKFPDYMKLDESQSPGGHLDGWEGATATITALADKPCRSATLQFLHDPQGTPTGEEVFVTVEEGTRLHAEWKLAFRADGTSAKHYRIQCKNDAGEVDPTPTVYNIAIQPDRPPEVVLLHPERDLTAPANAVIPLLVQASDPDFELGYITLHAEKGGTPLPRRLLSEGRQARVTIKDEFDLNALNLQPNDEIEFWIEAVDNRQPQRNRKNTPKLKIRIEAPVSKEDAAQQLAEQTKERDQRLDEAAQEQRGDQVANRDDRPRDDEQPESDSADEDMNPREASPPREDQESTSGNEQETAGGGKQDSGNRGGATGENSQTGDADAEHPSPQPDRETPLSSTGEDDEEALRRLNQHLNQQRKQRQDDAGEGDAETPTSKPGRKPGAKPAAENGSADNEDPDRSEQPPQKSEQRPAGKPDEQPPVKSGSKQKLPQPAQGTGDESSETSTTTGDPEDPAAKPKSAAEQPEGEPSRKGNSSRGTPTGEKTPAKSESTDEEEAETKTPADDGEQPKPGEKSRLPTSRERPAGDKPQQQDSPEKTKVEKTNPTDDSTEAGADPAETGTAENKTGETLNKNKTEKPDTPGPQRPEKSGKEKSGKKEASKTPGGGGEEGAGSDDPGEMPEPGEEGSGSSEASDSSAQKSSSQPSQKSRGKSSKNKPGQPSSSASDSPSDSSDSSSNDSGDEGDSNADNTGSETNERPAGKPPGKSERSPRKGTNQKNKQPSSKTGNDGGSDETPDGSENERSAADAEMSDEPGEGDAEKPARGQSDRPDPQARKTDLENPKERQPGTGKPPRTRQKTEGDADAADEELKGPGKPEGQKSDQPNGGEGGGSKQDQEGNTGSKTKGPGEKSRKTPGKQEVAGQKTGESDPDQQAGEGSESKAGGQGQGGKPSGDEASAEEQGEEGDQTGSKPAAKKTGQKSKAKSKSGEQSSESSNESSGEKSGKEGEKSGEAPGDQAGAGQSSGAESSADNGAAQGGAKGKPSKSKGTGKSGNSQKPGENGASSVGNSEQGDSKTNNSAGGGGVTGEVNADPEEANLEYNREAAELVLQKLKDDLNQDNVDPKLLEELGWTPEQLAKFVERLAKQLEKPAQELSPEEEARRLQFEEMLKSLDLKNGGTNRSGKGAPQREVDQSGARRAPVPADYKAAYEAFTRNLSRKKSGAAAAPKK